MKVKQTIGLVLILSIVGAASHAQPSKMELLGHWEDTTIEVSTKHGLRFNEVWGLWVNGSEYAVIGSTWGTHFIDITQPDQPREVARIKGAVTRIIHRDYHDYQCYLYAVCDQGRSTLQIMDISVLPDTPIVVYDSPELIMRSHNIFIDTAYGILYALATRDSSNAAYAMGVFDLRQDPTHPVLIGHYNQFGDLHVNHVHDAYVRDGIAYLHCGYDGFAIVDFRDPYQPQAIATLHPSDYPFSGYNHSGWLSDDRRYYFMIDETHGTPIKVLDLTNPSLPTVVALIKANDTVDVSIAHNAMVRGHYLFLSHYYDGLQIFDILNPREPVHKWYYPTSHIPHARGYAGAWGVYAQLPSGVILVSDMQNGLFVFRGVPDDTAKGVYSCQSKATSIRTPNASYTPLVRAYYSKGAIYVIANPPDAIPTDGPTQWTLYSIEGRAVGGGKTQLHNGRTVIPIALSRKGIYLIDLLFHTGQRHTQKIAIY